MADLYDAEVFRDFYCVEKQYITGRSTVLIDYPTGAGQISEEGGTGTLLPNGWILTCRHVIKDKEQAAKARIYFRFWRDQAGQIPTQHEGFQLDPEKGFLTDETGLDWVLVKLKDHSPQLFPFYVRPPDVPELEKDQRLMIFQCPNKHYVKFAQGSCSHIDENVVYYSINTNRGSSGGPVLNHAGDMVAIHRADKDSNNNQGIPLKAIIEELNRLAPQVMPEMCNYAKIHPVSINLVKEKIHKFINLPAVPTLFKGREEDIEKVRVALTESGDRDSEYRGRCVVFGLGGIGKTRMVIEYARRYRDQYSSILLVEARSPESFRANIANLCDNLGIQESEPSRKFSRVKAWFEENLGWLLIVDNVDDDKTSIEVQNFTANLYSGKVLLTSQLSRWKNRGFTPIELQRINRKSSIEVILEGTEQERTPTDSDQQDADALANKLGDFPLALQQAVGCISSIPLSIGGYLERWELADQAVIEWHEEATLNYPRSIATCWELSFASMKPEGRDALGIICWLAPAPIPRTLLEKVKEQPDPFDIEKGLSELAKYSFLRWVDIDKKFVQVHGVVSDITRYRMSDSEKDAELNKSLKAASIFILNYAAWDPATWPIVYNPCREHLFSLIQHCDAVKQSLLVAQIMNKLGIFLHRSAEYEQAELLHSRSLNIREASLGLDHPEVATSLNNLANLLSDTNRKEEAEPLFRRALSIKEASLGPDHPEVATSLNNLANLLSDTNRMAEAELVYRRALSIMKDSLGPNHPEVATSLNNLAQLLSDTNRKEEAEPLFRRALSIKKASLGPDHPEVATSINNLAQLLSDTNRKEEAEPLFRRALSIKEVSLGPNHPEVAFSLNNLALLLSKTNRKEEAEPLFRRALSIKEASLGPDHPDIAMSLNNLANLLYDTNRMAEAELVHRRALSIMEASLGPNHPEVATSINNLAQLHSDTNRKEEAEPLFRRALSIKEASLGPDHPEVATSLNNLANLLSDTNRKEEAEPLFRRSLSIKEASLVPNHPEVATSINNLAQLLSDTNRKEEAEPLFRRALSIKEASLGPDHPDVAFSLNNLALLLYDTNRMAEAEHLYRRSLNIKEASLGPDHTDVATSLINLAVLLYQTNRKEEAEPLAKRALTILIAHVKSSAEPNFFYEPTKAFYSIILKSLGYTPERIAITLSEIEAEAISKLSSKQKPQVE